MHITLNSCNFLRGILPFGYISEIRPNCCLSISRNISLSKTIFFTTPVAKHLKCVAIFNDHFFKFIAECQWNNFENLLELWNLLACGLPKALLRSNDEITESVMTTSSIVMLHWRHIQVSSCGGWLAAWNSVRRTCEHCWIRTVTSREPFSSPNRQRRGTQRALIGVKRHTWEEFS